MTSLNLTDTKWLHRPLWELTAKKPHRKIANETYAERSGDHIRIIYRGERIALLGINSFTLLGQARTPDTVQFRMGKVLRDQGVEKHSIGGGRFRRSMLNWQDTAYHNTLFQSVTFERRGDEWIKTIVPPDA